MSQIELIERQISDNKNRQKQLTIDLENARQKVLKESETFLRAWFPSKMKEIFEYYKDVSDKLTDEQIKAMKASAEKLATEASTLVKQFVESGSWPHLSDDVKVFAETRYSGAPIKSSINSARGQLVPIAESYGYLKGSGYKSVPLPWREGCQPTGAYFYPVDDFSPIGTPIGVGKEGPLDIAIVGYVVKYHQMRETLGMEEGLKNRLSDAKRAARWE